MYEPPVTGSSAIAAGLIAGEGMLKGAMDRRETNVRGLLALVAMLFAVFVIVPIADAATCGAELSVAAAEHLGETFDIDSHDDAGGDHAPGPSHGPCAHGHCHHASTALAAQGDAQDSLVRRGAVPAMPPEAQRASLTPDGLERPPRI